MEDPRAGEPDDDIIRIRDCFSVKYIQSAAFFCRMAWEIEADYDTSRMISADRRLRHEAVVLNAVFSSVAFLEATINELWSDAADDAYCFPDERTEALLRAIGEQWNNENYFDRTPLPAKYQRVLAIAERPQFSEDDPDFAGIKSIISIRNYLMHYRREWTVIPSGPGPRELQKNRTETLDKALKNRLRENPMVPTILPFFPDRCLGHGCAEWSVVTCLTFTDRFFLSLRLPAPYDGVRKELVTR